MASDAPERIWADMDDSSYYLADDVSLIEYIRFDKYQRVVEALRPLAKMAEHYERYGHKDQTYLTCVSLPDGPVGITLQEVMDARAALADDEGKEQ